MRVTLCMLLFLDVMTVSVALHQVSFCVVFFFIPFGSGGGWWKKVLGVSKVSLSHGRMIYSEHEAAMLLLVCKGKTISSCRAFTQMSCTIMAKGF